MDYLWPLWASQVVLLVKNSPANSGDTRDSGSIPGLGRSPGEGNGNPFQCSCLENPKDRGAWRAPDHRVAKSRTWLRDLVSTRQPFLPNDCDRHHMTDSVKNVYYLVFTYMWDLENKTNKHNKTETDSQRGGCQRGGMKGDEWKRWGRLRGTCWRYEMSAAGPSPRAPDQQRSYWVRPHSRRWVAGKTETTPLHTCSPQPGLWKKYLHKTSSGAKMVGNHWYTT